MMNTDNVGNMIVVWHCCCMYSVIDKVYFTVQWFWPWNSAVPVFQNQVGATMLKVAGQMWSTW